MINMIAFARSEAKIFAKRDHVIMFCTGGYAQLMHTPLTITVDLSPEEIEEARYLLESGNVAIAGAGFAEHQMALPEYLAWLLRDTLTQHRIRRTLAEQARDFKYE
jgi:hypothetical protein